MREKYIGFLLIFSFFIIFFNDSTAFAGNFGVNVQLGNEEDLTGSIKTFLLIGILALAPAFILMLTPFPYIVIILGLTKQGLGTQAIPPPQVLTGVALFVTIFIMSPVINEVYTEAYVPYDNGSITVAEATKKAEIPIKQFMATNTEEKSIMTFLKLREEEKPKNIEELSLWTAIPAFSVSMMNKGLFMGLMIYASFVVIDLLVGSILMFMGMMMLPPQIVSVPFKLLVFVAVGGFDLIIELIFSSLIT
jgi:flagellar biosynthesis protein FliP